MERIKLFFSGWKQGMHTFGETIAVIINTLLLTVIFVVGIGFVAVCAKIGRKRFLNMKNSEKEKETYWEEVKIGGEKNKEEYLKPF
ncbi:MAG TPA: hypothetical protein VFE88_00425 [Candidatus Nanoarchaeia archaeon]|nr:hypothetical protein [Candidatus Nanoarchaeia archaeon]